MEHQHGNTLSPNSYPVQCDEPVPRPRLTKKMELSFYSDNHSYEMRNSMVWMCAHEIQSMLPAEEMLAYLSKLTTLRPPPKNPSWTVPLKQPPDIMHGFITEILQGTPRQKLRKRWNGNYGNIMVRYRYLDYRMRLREKIFSQRLMDEKKSALDNDCRRSRVFMGELFRPPDRWKFRK